MPSDLALITGATKGIGRAVALALASHNIKLLITGRDKHDLQTLKEKIEGQNGSCEYVLADLSEPASYDRLTDAISNQAKPLRLLVHSAGIARVGKISAMPLRDWQENLAINLTAPFHLSQKCLPFMRSGSSVVFINSVAGKTSFPEWAAYSAAKAGLAALADTLRLEVQEQGIKVISIFPTSVDTPLQDKLPYNWDRTNMLTADQVADIVKFCYLQPDKVMLKNVELANIAGTFK